MEAFTYSYPVKVYFGEKAAEKNLPSELAQVGENVLLAYGVGSIKKNGVYDELMSLLKAAGKTVTEFTGIMSNPTYAKVQEGVKLAKDNKIDFIVAVCGGSVIDRYEKSNKYSAVVTACCVSDCLWQHGERCIGYIDHIFL